MDLSVLIACHNRADLTHACLRSLQRTLPPGLSAEILVYDDRSTDGTTELLEAEIGRWKGRLAVFRDDRRGTYARNNNLLARAASGRRLLLLNNDTECRPGWLEPMLARAEAGDQHGEPLGVVGNLHAFPTTGRLAHAGVVIDRDLIPRNLYEGLPEPPEPARHDRPMTAACAACVMIDRDLYLSAGSFDEGFVNGHEDVDLCLRLARDRRPTWIAGRSMIDHRTSSSSGRFDCADANHRRFLKRWSDSLQPDLESVTASDGVRWPNHGLAYRAARAIWRFPPARAVLTPVLRSPSALGARQRLIGSLSGRRSSSEHRDEPPTQAHR